MLPLHHPSKRGNEAGARAGWLQRHRPRSDVRRRMGIALAGRALRPALVSNHGAAKLSLGRFGGEPPERVCDFPRRRENCERTQ